MKRYVISGDWAADEDPDGEWVKYEDVAIMLENNQQAVAILQQLKGEIQLEQGLRKKMVEDLLDS